MRELGKYYTSNYVGHETQAQEILVLQHITKYWLEKRMGTDYLRGRQEIQGTRMNTWAGSNCKRRFSFVAVMNVCILEQRKFFAWFNNY
jgi:hypothetical protein